ncbi:bifunctional DNA primase/polymerase [Nocardia sp. CA-128927]|uniref:bifunctional DNA primase/polymerase n=1 Tax=Nocardia sp. CA-128927 TaxID=3239975 RepID=UPI003D974CCF
MRDVDVPAQGGEMMAHALAYARAGLAVLPLAPAGKVPVVEHGKDDATTDPEVIRAWWERNPLCNIGIRPLVGRVVLDVDPRSGGSLEALGELPDTWMAATGGGGWHVWFRCTGRMRGRLDGVAGVDIKTHTGYVVAAPSVHPSGIRYRWLNRAPVAVLPMHLRDKVRLPARRADGFGRVRTASGGAGLVNVVASAQEGNRNQALFWAACRAYDSGGDPNVLQELMFAAMRVGLPDSEIEATLQSAQRRAA